MIILDNAAKRATKIFRISRVHINFFEERYSKIYYW